MNYSWCIKLKILAVSSGNEMLGFVYHIQVTDVYRVFYHFLHFKYWIHICFRLKYRRSSFFVIESQNILSFNGPCYYLQYNKTKYIVKGFKSIHGEGLANLCWPKLLEVNFSYIVLGKKRLKLLTTPQNRFINQNNSWLYC